MKWRACRDVDDDSGLYVKNLGTWRGVETMGGLFARFWL